MYNCLYIFFAILRLNKIKCALKNVHAQTPVTVIWTSQRWLCEVLSTLLVHKDGVTSVVKLQAMMQCGNWYWSVVTCYSANRPGPVSSEA